MPGAKSLLQSHSLTPTVTAFPTRRHLLGHSRISTTWEIYAYADEEARRNALTQLHELFQHDEG